MTWARTIIDLTADVRLRTDTTGYSTRHTDAEIERYIQEAYQRMREWMTSAGSGRWVTDIAPSYYHVIDEHSICARCEGEHIQGMELKWNGSWIPLRRLNREEYLEALSSGGTVPEGYYLSGLVDSPSALGSAQYYDIHIAPWEGETDDSTLISAGIFRVRAIPQSPSTAGPFFLDAPGFDWIILEAASRIMTRNADSQNQYAIILQEREAARQIILAGIRTENIQVKRRARVGAQRVGRRHGW